MMWWHDQWTGWDWSLMVLSMVVVWAVVVGTIVWALRSRGDAGPAGPSARDTLDQRFARGEIGEDEYRRARDLLAHRG